MKYTRAELAGILAARHASQMTEGQGELTPWIEFRFRVTPEMLDLLMRGEFVNHEGERKRLTAVYIDAGGLVEPLMERIEVPA